MTNQDMELMKSDWDCLRGVLIAQNSNNSEVMSVVKDMDLKLSRLKFWVREYNNIQVEMGNAD